MEDLLRGWLPRVMAAVLLLAVIYLLAPPGRLRSAVRFTGGLVLLTVLLSPLTGLDLTADSSWADCRIDVEDRIRQMQAEYADAARTLIEERTAAYISDKGQALGVSCHPVVTTQLRDGVAYPFFAAMDCPYHPALSACLAEELDIPPERQSWQGR